jgi:hypothetical protein
MGQKHCLVGTREDEAYVDTAAGQKRDASLRVGRLVFGQELKLVVLVLKVSDIAISAEFEVSGRGGEGSSETTHPLPAR